MKYSQIYQSDLFEILERLLVLPTGLESRLRDIYEPYERFTIPKGDGGPGRTIEAPVPALKAVQSAILHQLLYRIPVAPDCHGFVPGRSIVTHARMHRNQNELLNYDIENAFPSVSRDRVVHSFHRRLASYIKHQAPRFDKARRDKVIELLADLVTWDGHLPQGAPTSGAVLNLVLAPLDRRLRKEVRKWSRKAYKGLIYSRYADDLNLSAHDELPPNADEVIRRAIHQAGFRFNPRKVHRADRALGQTLKICGIQVDGEDLRLPRKKLKTYRAVLHHAFLKNKLNREMRDKINGILGLTRMVYGDIPPLLKRPWKLLVARHNLKDENEAQAPQISGYSGS